MRVKERNKGKSCPCNYTNQMLVRAGAGRNQEPELSLDPPGWEGSRGEQAPAAAQSKHTQNAQGRRATTRSQASTTGGG